MRGTPLSAGPMLLYSYACALLSLCTMEQAEWHGLAGSEAQSSSLQDDAEPCAHHLYAYPLESNFDGTRYPESLASTVQSTRSGKPPVHCISHFSPRPSPVDSVSSTLTTHQSRLGQQNAVETSGSGEQAESGHRWWVLVDAAKACATRPPDLSLHKPAFLVSPSRVVFPKMALNISLQNIKGCQAFSICLGGSYSLA